MGAGDFICGVLLYYRKRITEKGFDMRKPGSGEVVCPECLGKGEYEILNAYDLNYRETIVCEYCHGKKVIEAPVDEKTVLN